MGRRRVRRLERQAEGGVVRIEQHDGTTRAFPTQDFWLELFTSAVAGASGERADSAVVAALENASPEAKARIDQLISEHGGDFLRGMTVDGLGFESVYGRGPLRIGARSTRLASPGFRPRS